MASVHKYKRVENNIVKKVKNLAGAIGRGISSFFRRIFKFAGSRYTVMVVPHSEKKVYNLHITVFSMICIVLVLVGILGAFVWYGTMFSDTRTALATKDTKLKDTQNNLDLLRDETSQLLKAAKSFEAALSQTLTLLGLDKNVANANSASFNNDLSSFFDIKETAEGASGKLMM